MQLTDNRPNILIVDDNEQNLSLLYAILRNLDVTIISAYSALEALELIKEKELAVAILDIRMPGMDGIELATILQNDPTRNKMPVLFLTSMDKDSNLIEQCYEAGAVDFILKPLHHKIILSKVQVFLELYNQKQKINEQKDYLEWMVAELENNNTVLKETEKMYRAMLNASPSGIVIMDTKGLITEVSDIVFEIFNSEKRDAFLGTNFYHLFLPGEKRSIKAMLLKAQKEGIVQNVEFILTPKNKSKVIVEVTITLIQDANGRPKGLMGIIRDITQRKKMEQQLIRSERLISLGEMASAMAHEINQPLLSITLGMENMLMRLKKMSAPDQPYFIEKAEKIFNDIARIGRIIDHVRAFSREQNDKVNALFNVNDSISNAVSMISEQFRHHSINIELAFDANLPLIEGDTYKFEQVILNLLNNAKDALEDKAKTTVPFDKNITIATYNKQHRNYIKVSDNGYGIKEEDIHRIMLPFFTTKKVGRGTGLGLSISYGIIKELNGNIEVESVIAGSASATNSASGTCFIITLPVKN